MNLDLNLVKGQGGFLLREMVESAHKRFLVVVDELKLVDWLSKGGLAMPIEVVPVCWATQLEPVFGSALCMAKLRTQGLDNCYLPITQD